GIRDFHVTGVQTCALPICYYLAPSYNSENADQAAPLEVLSEILGSGTTSRFFRSLVVDQSIATSAGTFYDPVAVDLASFGLYAEIGRASCRDKVWIQIVLE